MASDGSCSVPVENACVASFGSNLVHAACVTVALIMPRLRDTARCCVRNLVVAQTKRIVPGLVGGDGWCFEARNKKVASSIVSQLTEQEMEAVINGGSLPDSGSGHLRLPFLTEIKREMEHFLITSGQSPFAEFRG